MSSSDIDTLKKMMVSVLDEMLSIYKVEINKTANKAERRQQELEENIQQETTSFDEQRARYLGEISTLTKQQNKCRKKLVKLDISLSIERKEKEELIKAIKELEKQVANKDEKLNLRARQLKQTIENFELHRKILEDEINRLTDKNEDLTHEITMMSKETKQVNKYKSLVKEYKRREKLRSEQQSHNHEKLVIVTQCKTTKESEQQSNTDPEEFLSVVIQNDVAKNGSSVDTSDDQSSQCTDQSSRCTDLSSRCIDQSSYNTDQSLQRTDQSSYCADHSSHCTDQSLQCTDQSEVTKELENMHYVSNEIENKETQFVNNADADMSKTDVNK